MKTSFATVVALALAPSVVHAFWRMSCGIIQTGRIDPVATFGSAAPHVHKLSGAANVNINSTQDSLTASSCTSCQIQADKSAYWTPQLYYAHPDGTFEEVPNNGMAVYYLNRGDEGGWQPFPKGLKMLSGSNGARSYNSTALTTLSGGRPLSDRVSYACIDYNNPQPQTPGFGNLTCPNGLRAQIQMQSCWDGVHLNSTNQSHMAYLSQIDNGVCPPGYPVLLPHLFYEVLYDVAQIKTSNGGHYVFSNGDTTGYGFHGGFINGWDNAVLTDAIAKCLVQNANGVIDGCSSFAASNSLSAASACTERSCTNSASGVTCAGDQPTCAANYAPYGLQVSPGNSEYSSIGCYTEATTGRALASKTYTNAANMTVESCLAFCSGYKYAGVEYGQECYCGNTISAGSAPASSGNCSMSCKGNVAPSYGELCGGGMRLNMYQSKIYASPSSSAKPSTMTPTANQATTPSVGGYNYVGCYTEAMSGRALNLASKTDKAMTAEMCASYCSSLNYPMFGLEYSTECYCGTYTQKGSVSAPSPSDCKMSCGGSSAEICGGPSRLSLYALKSYTAPSIPQTFSGYNYAGCYAESTSGGRALASATLVNYTGMTLGMCATFCKGYALFGVEYGGECRCAQTISSTSRLAPGGDGDCATTCPGNYSQLACGGSMKFNLYRLPAPAAINVKGRVTVKAKPKGV